MTVGAASEVLNIVASEGGVAVESQNAQLSNVVNGRQVVELPLITRNPYDLIALSAGATDGPDRGSGSERGGGFVVNGQRSQSGNFILDGGENNDTFNAKPGQKVPLDAIQEFRVQTNNYTAEYGRGSGFVANVVTKSGSNGFHGTVYEFNRNAALAANDFFNNANGLSKPQFNRNQFGFSGGGPIVRDKTFFFGSAEWVKVRSSVDTGFYVPTPELLAASSAATQSIFAGLPGADDHRPPDHGRGPRADLARERDGRADRADDTALRPRLGDAPARRRRRPAAEHLPLDRPRRPQLQRPHLALRPLRLRARGGFARDAELQPLPGVHHAEQGPEPEHRAAAHPDLVGAGGHRNALRLQPAAQPAAPRRGARRPDLLDQRRHQPADGRRHGPARATSRRPRRSGARSPSAGRRTSTRRSGR